MRCKAGELAIISYDDSKEQYSAVGLIVEVVKFLSAHTPCDDGTFVYFPDQPNLGLVWHIRTLGSGIPLHQRSTGDIDFVTDAPWPDKWLSPLPKLHNENLEDLFSTPVLDQKAVKELDKVKLNDAPKLLFKMKAEGKIYNYSILKHGFQVQFKPNGPNIFYIVSKE